MEVHIISFCHSKPQITNAKKQYSSAIHLCHFILPKLQHIGFWISRYNFIQDHHVIDVNRIVPHAVRFSFSLPDKNTCNNLFIVLSLIFTMLLI